MKAVNGESYNTYTVYHLMKGIILKIILHFALLCHKEKATLNKHLHNSGLKYNSYKWKSSALIFFEISFF